MTLTTLHEDIPALGMIWSFLWLYDTTYLQDEIYQEKQRIWANLGEFVKWKQEWNGPASEDGHWLELDDVRNDIALYSPYWKFSWQVSEAVESLQLIYSHKWRDVTRVYDISLNRGEEAYDRSYEVHLWRETLFNGENEYLVQATYADGRVISRKVRLQVAYERIVVGDTTLYLDSSYIPADKAEDILWEAPDFEWDSTNFITYGCDPDISVPPILMQRSLQYTTVPACFTFSTIKDYFLWFNFRERTTSSYLYDIISPAKWRIYQDYPLFTYDLNTVYFALVFYDIPRQRLKILTSKGDMMSYVLEILYYDINKKRDVVSVVNTNGTQLLVENEKEKMYLYMYKQRDNYRSLVFPWMRYQFWFRGAQINQWNMYDLPFDLYSPLADVWPTFTFDVSLDGTRLYIEDGVKRMSFDITSMWKTIEVNDMEYKLNQPWMCDTADVEIYQNTRGDIPENASTQDTLWLVGKWFHASSLQIFHNNWRIPIDVDQTYQWWFHLRLHADGGRLDKWKNTYTIVTYNEAWRKVCTIQKEITIQ